MKKSLFLLFVSISVFSQHQEMEPTIFSEISEKISPRDYYNIKLGYASEIIVNDTIFLADAEKWIEKYIYSFHAKNEFSVKKYRNNEFIADETISLDSNKRIMDYHGNLKYEGGKWYDTRVKYTYDDNKKIKEKINDSGEIYMRYTVKYDSLRNPIVIEHNMVGPEYARIENINYDYDKGKFIKMDFNYQGQLNNEIKGDIISDYIITTNKYGDVTKMYWILTDKNEPFIHEMAYDYDKFGNWIRMIKNIIYPDGSIKPYHRTYRKIKYKN